MSSISPIGRSFGAQTEAKVNWRGIAEVRSAIKEPMAQIKAAATHVQQKPPFNHTCRLEGQALASVQAALPSAATLAQSQARFHAVRAA